jgi:response regulator RpfG family c-di-GMP phosphodiesterase
MSDTILLVDDDVRVVSALQRSLYRDYRIEIAAGPGDALDAIAHTAYAVVVSDLQMPGMNGIDLLTTVKETSPDTVRVLLTGQADLETAIAAVNEGNIFRFLTKPCPHELLKRTLDAALEQHWLQISEKDVLRETLMGTVAVLVEILGAIQPIAFGRASRIRHYVGRLAAELQLAPAWEFEAAAMLSQIGYISVDPSVLKRYFAGEALAPEEMSQVLSQAGVGQALLHQDPRLHAVSLIIGRQHQAFEDRPKLDPTQYMIALGSEMLRAAIDFDRLIGSGLGPDAAIAEMRRNESEYSPGVFKALQRIKRDLVLPNTIADSPDEIGSPRAEGRALRG